MEGWAMTSRNADHNSMQAQGAMIEPPPFEAPRAQIDAYVATLFEQPELDPPVGTAELRTLLMASLALVPRHRATHTAVWDGDWNDPKTWYRGQVPSAGARVLIPEGVHVQIGALLETRIFTIRVDGELEFATDVDSRVVFDTLVVSPTGSLLIGTELDPVPQNVTVDLLIADNGALDPAWDPARLSRGIISHGQTRIHGTARKQVASVDEAVRAGDSALCLGRVPPDWQVGDTIIVATPAQKTEEARIIADLDAETVYFDEPLHNDHLCPLGRPCEVLNLARSIVIETENASVVRNCDRGHVLLVGDSQVSVHFAEFHELGRPDIVPLSHGGEKPKDLAAFHGLGRHPLQVLCAGPSRHRTPKVSGNTYWRCPGQAVALHDLGTGPENTRPVMPSENPTHAHGMTISSFGIAWQENGLSSRPRPRQIKHRPNAVRVDQSRSAPVRVSALYSCHYFRAPAARTSPFSKGAR
jgi:hypothetical protein